MLLVAFSAAAISWTATPGHRLAAAPLARQRRLLPVVLEDPDPQAALLATLERLEAKIDSIGAQSMDQQWRLERLESKIDSMGSQGIETKWQAERLEGKVDYLGHLLMKSLGMVGDQDDESYAPLQARPNDGPDDGTGDAVAGSG